jgi:hypothetical protein
MSIVELLKTVPHAPGGVTQPEVEAVVVTQPENVMSGVTQPEEAAVGAIQTESEAPGTVLQPLIPEPVFIHQPILDWLDELEWTWDSLGPEMTDEAGVVWQLAMWYPSYLMRLKESTKYALIMYHHLGPGAPRSVAEQKKYWSDEDIAEQMETLDYRVLCVHDEAPYVCKWARSLVEKARVWRDPNEDTEPVDQQLPARSHKKGLAVHGGKKVRKALTKKKKK